MSIPGHESDCPFQRLETCNDMLLVARMGSIHTYTYDRADDRFKYLWTWKAPAPDGSPPSPRGSALPEDARNMDSPSNPDGQGGLEDVIEPSAKRRRLEGAGDASETPVTVSSNGAEENGRTDSKAGSPQPNGSSEESRYSRIVCCMKATRDHLVATTYHDKAVRVFKVNPNGRLELLSERIMPKRPIAIDILGGKTIICADKFGDVYSLPLLPSPEDATQIKEGVAVKSASSKPAAGSLAAAAASETFRPEANELTVHSRRNLRALESQKFEAERRQRQMQKQKQEREQQQQRTASADSATLLLGHVSMLTSIAIVTLRDDETKRHRTYIATSDRDSHIRLSRPPPQSYVCEAFLLTHEAFVSRLAAVRAPSVAEGGNGVRQVLVSGAGEATLQVWNSVRLSDSKSWAAQQLDFGELLQDRKTVAVNGLFPVAIPSTDNAAVSDAGLFVTFEGVSTLFFFTVNHNEDFKDSHRPIFDPIPQTYSLPGPPLAVTSFGTSASSLSVAVSIDLRGSPASTEDADSAMVSTKEQPLRRFEWIAAEGRWEFRPGTKFDAPLPEKDVQFAHLLDEALAVEPLRKREGDFISGN